MQGGAIYAGGDDATVKITISDTTFDSNSATNVSDFSRIFSERKKLPDLSMWRGPHMHPTSTNHNSLKLSRIVMKLGAAGKSPS